MCLAVPGRVVSIEESSVGMNMGKVNFGGILKQVCLAYVPEVMVGDYVLVHVGFAISKVDEEEAAKVFEYLKEMGELEGLQQPDDDSTPQRPS
ncbi:MAG: HypC/HybG/HupF family hydrogenase formation chaperone [Ignavibacteriae bacterium]|nr:HypC/HybG/HupF family hydrogenase formation chaperone [Ignavibacteriota bacterium]